MDRGGAPERPGRGLRQADEPGLAVVDQPRHGADRVLDRDGGIDPRHAEHVEAVDAEAREALFADGAEALAADDTRHKFPRVQADNFAANRERVARLEAVAAAKGASAAQIALAWLLARGDDVFPIPGCKTRAHLEDNLAALEIELGPADLAELDDAFPIGTAAGTRYPEQGMKGVDK